MPPNATSAVTNIERMTNTPAERTGSSPVMPKAERCRLSGCPYASRVCEKDSPCAECTGPVVWKSVKPNGETEIHGRCRSCTGCPMNGKGLPVCWAACPGPNQDFTTDGESMVMLGGMENPDSYLAAYSVGGRGEEPAEVRRMVADIDGEESANPDDDGHRWSFAGFESESEETRAARIAERLLSIDGSTMEMLMKLHRRNVVTVHGETKDGSRVSEVFPTIHEARGWARVRCRAGRYSVEEDRRTVAERIGCDMHSVNDENGIVSRIFARLHGMNAGDWDNIRSKAMGLKQTTAARLMMVTKQAVSKREKKIALSAGVSIGKSHELRSQVSIHPTTGKRAPARATQAV